MSESNEGIGLNRVQSLPRLADRAVRSTLAPPRSTMILCGLVMALINGGLTAIMALVSGSLNTTAGSLIALGSMMVWLPVTIALTILVTLILAVYATHRTLLKVELSLFEAMQYIFRPRVLATLILMVGAIAVATLFLVIPGVIVAAFLSLVVPVMVSERVYLVAALVRSSELVWSNPERRILTLPLVRVLAITAVVVALSTLMTLVMQVPLQLMTQGMMFREALSGAEPSTSTFAAVNWISLPFTLVLAVVNVGVYSYFFHSLAMFYSDLVERREARSLGAAISELALIDNEVP